MESKLKRIVIKFIISLAHKLGYDIALIKYSPGEIEMQGDVKLLKFIDTVKYIQHKNKIKQ
jgi:hypothetical protein